MTTFLEFHPLTAERWSDLQTLFESNAGCRSCWCMWWRLSASDWTLNRGKQNRNLLKTIVNSGKIPCIIAYSNNQPIGWCSISPREEYGRLERSRTLKRVDKRPVWSVVCFFVSKPFRRQGVSAKLLQAAVSYAKKQGAIVVEGYPSKSKGKQNDALAYTGLVCAYERLGFKPVAESKTRIIMRLNV